MLRMTKDERTQAEAAIAKMLRGATTDSSKTAIDTAIAALDETEAEEFFEELADEFWTRAGAAILDASILFVGPFAEADRNRLIEEICQRLAKALHAPADEN
jgi:hypothetical protein